VIRHCLFGAAHIDRIGRATGLAALGQSNPGTMREMPGGAAFNVASSLAALGASVTLFSAAGSDLSGEQVSTEATARGVDLIGLKSFPQRPTATYTAILDTNGDLITALSDMEIYDGVQLDRANPAEDDWLHVDTNFPEQILPSQWRRPIVCVLTLLNSIYCSRTALKPPRYVGFLRKRLSVISPRNFLCSAVAVRL